MNALFTKLHRKTWRAGRARSHAARGGGMRSRGVQNAAERGGWRRKIWKPSKAVWKPCNPLKSHKTAKDLFGKAWSKTREFWRSLEKGLQPPLFRHRWLPPASVLRSGGIVIARRGCEATQEAVRPAKGGLSVEKRQARFIRGDRLEAGVELVT